MPPPWRAALECIVFGTRDRSWLLLALGLRLGFALSLGGRFHQTDEVGFSEFAWNLASTGTLGKDGAPWATAPLPSAFFAACFRLFGTNLLFPRLAQAFVSAGTAWLLGRMTASLTGSPRAGRLALAAAAVYPFFIYYSGMVLSETLYLAFAVPGLWWLCASLQERGRSWRPAAAGGAALAAAALCRPEAMPIALLLWLAGLVACAAGLWSRKALFAAVLAWSLPLTAWCARNRAAVGVFALDTHGGLTLLHGTLLFDENEQDTGLAMAALEKMPFYQKSLSLPLPQRDGVYLRRGLAFMRDNPGRVLRQWARKAVNFWRPYPRPDKAYREDVFSHPGAGLSRTGLVAVSLVCEPVLILGGFWGLWALRRRWAELHPLGLFLLGTMAIHVVSVSQMRYRLPIMPILILAAAAAAAARLERTP
ncbi:MAG: glycosyltransferase family 39 protein [Elusimicrobia bacterium]|nr:glycosyltransferase family 39 protein [Elusimicrobiota bacterium]